MKKNILLIIFIIVNSYSYSQYFHIGLGAFATLNTNVSILGKDFFIASENNDQFRVDSFYEFPQTLNVISPNFYISYQAKNFWFIRAEANSFILNGSLKSTGVKSPYSGGYVPFHNFTFSFIRSSIDVGVTPIIIKKIKPYIFAGFSNLSMIHSAYKQNSNNQEEHGLVISNIDDFNINTFYYRFGGGIKYYNLFFQIGVEKNLLKIDSSKNPFWNSYSTLYATLCVNIFSLNLATNKNKILIKDLKTNEI